MQQLNDDLYYSLLSENNPVLLSASVRNVKKNVSRQTKKKQIERFLAQQNAITLHRPAIRNFKRNHYYVNQINQLWEMDIIDMQMYKKENDNFKFILVVLDAFTKFAYCKLLRSKGAFEVAKKFKEIIDESNAKPETLRSDRGKEFTNSTLSNYLRANSIKHQYPQTSSPFKCAMVEIFNRTLQNKIHRFFTYSNSHRYVDVLRPIVGSYNATVHSTTKMAPKDIRAEHVVRVYENTHRKHRSETKKRSRLVVGDLVRVVKKKNAFNRGYLASFSKEIFRIDRVIEKHPFPLYELRDLKDNKVAGKLYEQELSKVELKPNEPVKLLQRTPHSDRTHVELMNGQRRWLTSSELRPRHRHTTYSDVYDTLFKKK